MDKANLAEAIEMFRKSAEIAPHYKTFELLGECLMKHNQALDAIAPLAAAVGLGTRPFRARFLLGKALAFLGEKEDAIAHLEQAVALKPDYKTAREFFLTLKSPPFREIGR